MKTDKGLLAAKKVETMNQELSTWTGTLGLMSLMTFGCSGQEAALRGTEKGACYPNNTCNAGLVCLSQLCVRIPEAGLPFDARFLDRPPGPPMMPDGMMPPPFRPDGGFPRGDRGKKPPTDAMRDRTAAPADKTMADKSAQ
jgi:hypothetical protein